MCPTVRETGERRIRVALVSEFPVGEDQIPQGGVQSVAQALAHALARRGDIECHVVSAMRGAEKPYHRVGHLHVHYVRRPNLPRVASGRHLDAPAIARAIRAIGPDVVHGQGQDRHALGALDAGYPTVITPHGVFFVESRLLRRSRYDVIGAVKAGVMNSWEREVFRRATHMVVISRYLPQIYRSMLTAEATFIDNPIDPGFFALSRHPEPGRLLFCGSVVPRKCVHDLVVAFNSLRRQLAANMAPKSLQNGLRLRIAGPLVHAETELRLRDSIAAMRLEGHVELLGAVSESDLRAEYSKAHLLLLASREETAPQVIAQGMACGLPTVAAASGGVPAMIRDGETGLLFPFSDTEKCSEVIERVLLDEPLWTRISRNIVVEGRQRFHPDSVADQTVAVYRDLLATSESRPGR